MGQSPADVPANRVVSSVQIFLTPAYITSGTGTEQVINEAVIPPLNGTTAINWDGSGTGTGTADSWRRVPGVEDPPKIGTEHKTEDYTPADMFGVPAASDVIFSRIKEIGIECKETGLTNLCLGFATGLAGTGSGYTSLKPPMSNTDVTVYSMAIVMPSPTAGKKSILWIPRVQRSTAGIPENKKASVRTQNITFDALGYSGTLSEFTTGQTYLYLQQS